MTSFFVKGADISILNEIESLGGKYYIDGKEEDCFEILRLHNINTIRLRIWVDPFDRKGVPYLGGTNDIGTTMDLAKRAKLKGMKIMLNFHYSDFWADPKKQVKPKSWESLTGQSLIDKVYSYTKNVLDKFKDNNIFPEYVQIGNEITNGMLWPDGKTPTYLFEERKFERFSDEKKRKSFDKLANLLKAGIKATKHSLGEPQAKIILHLDFGGANDLYRTWFDEVSKRDVMFDIIGLSYYPFWHGTLDELQFNMNDISARYNKDVLVVETSYGFTSKDPSGKSIFTNDLAKKAGYPATVDGQKQFLVDLMNNIQKVKSGRGIGIVYWEPGWLPLKGTSWASNEGMEYANDIADMGNHWANQALFDFNGNALDSLGAFKTF